MGTKSWFTSLRCNTWPDVKKTLDEFGGRWVFRGQADADWKLMSSLERETPPDFALVGAEYFLLNQFRRRAHHFLNGHLVPESTLDWLALMQHYGAPTRLLDWTASAYVASYFALEEARDLCAIWAIDHSFFYGSGLEKLRRCSTRYRDVNSISFGDDEVFREITIVNSFAGIFQAQPFLQHERLAIQQGLFYYTGLIGAGFEANLKSLLPDSEQLRPVVYKIEVPQSVRRDGLDDLNRMNINRVTLFPGLDGFAQHLKYRLATLGSADDDWLRSPQQTREE